MKRFVVHVAKSVVHAIEEQTQYIKLDKPMAAANWLEALWDKIQSLESFPHRHPISEHDSKSLGSPVRNLVFGAYLIFYQIDEQNHVVEVIQFRHAARLPDDGVPSNARTNGDS